MPENVSMTGRAARPIILMAAMAVLLIGSATFFSGPGPVWGSRGPSPEALGPVLAAIARALWIPLDTPAASDVRILLIPLVAGAALIATAAAAMTRGRAAAVGSRAPLERWLVLLCAGVAATAAISATVNRTWDYSAGWIASFAAGAIWAGMLARLVPPERSAALVAVALVIGGSVCGLALWHRWQTGLRYFIWPIGPVTPTAAISAVVAATGIGAALGCVAIRPRHRPPEPAIRTGRRRVPGGFGWVLGPASATGAGALAVLWLSDRRAPLLGAACGSLFAIVWLVLLRVRTRRAWAVAGLTLAGACIGAGVWVRGQMTSPDVGVRGSISYRLTYWRESAALIGESPWLGAGPDSFARVMTPRLALRRAAQPHVLHGGLDAYAHNEWLQAAVEIGAPGALLYLAIPIVSIFAACRSMVRNAQVSTRGPCITALAAGVLTVVVLESGGISLRTATLQPWYWTWIGLLSAAGKAPVEGAARRGRWFGPVGIIGGALLAATTVREANRMSSHAAADRAKHRGEPAESVLRQLEAARGRMGFLEWLDVETDLAAALVEQVRQAGAAASGVQRSAIERLAQAAMRLPAVASFEIQYAEALVLAGQENAAREVLARHLREVDPYSYPANLVLARDEQADADERLDRVLHALRGEAITTELEGILDVIRDPLAEQPEWRARVASAAKELEGGRIESDSLAPEVLRIAAYWLRSVGDIRQAVEIQEQAARQYRAWYESAAPMRRRHDAEWDAWYRLAQWRYEADPGDYERAWQDQDWAERFALLGYPHEHVRTSKARAEFFGDEVVPTSDVERLRPLWRQSTMLRIATGREDHLMFRALLSLAVERQVMSEAMGVVRELAGQLVRDFERVPAEQRPRHFEQIARLGQAGS